MDEVIDYQKSLKMGESHFQDLRMKERAYDKEHLHETLNKERILKQKLGAMLPQITFNSSALFPVRCTHSFQLASGHRSNEKNSQKQRERQFGGFGVIYQAGNVPNNPVKEFDEIYMKDEKRVAQVSLKTFSQDQLFNSEIEKLKPEIGKLPDGEFFSLTL